MAHRLPVMLAGIAMLLLLSACGGGGGGGSVSTGTGSADLIAAFPSSSSNALLSATFADVASVDVEVFDGADPLGAFAMSQDFDGNWTATAEGLPLGIPLIFAGHAYDSAAVRNATTEIFSGAVIASLTAGANSLGLVMVPVEGGVGTLLPTIEHIAVPTGMEPGAGATLQFLVSGEPGELLDYNITNGGGSFSTTAGGVSLLGTGFGVIATDYTAPSLEGLYSHSIQVTNSNGNSVTRSFDTSVVAGGFNFLSITMQATVADCPNGGVEVVSGIDQDGSGTLDPFEVDVSLTQVICNGENGVNGFSSLVLVSPEDPGPNCANGGLRIESGLDDGTPDGIANNLILEIDPPPAEVDQTSYVCNSGEVLIRATIEPPGPNCTAGGTKIEVGLDNDPNGIDNVLDNSEVTGDPIYICATEPFGEGLVFLADKEINNKFDLFRAREDGSETVKLAGADFLGGQVLEYQISPDGSRVIMAADFVDDGITSVGLYLVDLQNGGDIINIMAQPASSDGGLYLGGFATNFPPPSWLEFKWSPDGSRVAFLLDAQFVPPDFVRLLVVVNLAAGQPGITVTGIFVTLTEDVVSFQWSPDSQRLVFLLDKEVDEEFELFTMWHDGTGVQKISPPLVANGDVSAGNIPSSNANLGVQWAPNGTRIAFVADAFVDGQYELFTVRPDGTGLVQLTSLGATGVLLPNRLHWSPDSSKVAIVHNPATPGTLDELYVVTADQPNSAVKVSGNMQTNGLFNLIEWSPDSTKIAYTADQETDGVLELFVSTPDGASNVKVSGDLTASGGALLHLDNDHPVRFSNARLWSPVDGARLAYIADQEVFGRNELYTVLPDGSGLAKVNDPLTLPEALRWRWSPDGSAIAYLAFDRTDPNSFAGEIFTAVSDGTSRVSVSGTTPAGTRTDGIFKWSPDGTRVAYSIRDIASDERIELRTVLADGTANVNVSGPLVASGSVPNFLWREVKSFTHVFMTALEVTPVQPRIPLNTEFQLRATGFFSDGSVRDVTRSVDWFADGFSATVSNTTFTKGLVTALNFGGSETIDTTDPETGLTVTTVVNVVDFTATEVDRIADPVSPNVVSDQFGASVAVSGNTAIAGALGADIALSNQGAAYVYERDSVGSWGVPIRLLAPDAVAGDGFGFKVAIEGNTAIIGAPQADPGNLLTAGAAYIFQRAADGTWSSAPTLVAPDAAAGDEFGVSVAISGNTAVVGAFRADAEAGVAYIFTRNLSGVWQFTKKLVSPALDAAAGDLFGASVGISGDTVIVGARFASPGASSNAGSAFVFQRTNGVWDDGTLLANGTAAGGQFGISAAIDGNTAIVGAEFISGSTGAAYVFERVPSTGVWGAGLQLIPSVAAGGDRLGNSVAISGDVALVGARGKDNGANADTGAVYVFTRTTGTWSANETDTLTASDLPAEAVSDAFGQSVGISGSNVIVGTHLVEDVSPAPANTGAVYIFE